MLKINTDIPLPAKAVKETASKAKVLFKGTSDDFKIVSEIITDLPCGASTDVVVNNRSTFTVNLSQLSKRFNKKFTSRCIEKERPDGRLLFRVWRLEKEEEKKATAPLKELFESVRTLPYQDFAKAKYILDNFEVNEWIHTEVQDYDEFMRFFNMQLSKANFYDIERISYRDENKNRIKICRVR